MISSTMICKNCKKPIVLTPSGYAHPTEYHYDSIGQVYYAEYCNIIGLNYDKAEPLTKSDNFQQIYNTLNG